MSAENSWTNDSDLAEEVENTHLECLKLENTDCRNGSGNTRMILDNFESLMRKFYYSLKVKDNCVELVNFLVAKEHVDVNHMFTEQFIELPCNGWTALHFVCKKDNNLLVKCLLDLGADPAIVNKKGESALHIACKLGHYKCAEILLNHDNSLKDKQNNQGLTALMKAIYRSDTSFKENNYRKTIDALILANCDVNLSPPSNMSPLHVLAGKWHSTVLVKELIISGANVNANTERSSALMTALCRQKVNTETVMVLIDNGADVNYKNEYQKSLLHVAVAKSEDICVKHLLLAGAQTNVVDLNGLSPLWIAVCDNNVTIAPMLLKYGGEVNFVTHDYSMSLLCKAACDVNNKLMKLLLDYGADINKSTKLGATALHYAVDNMDIEKVKLLLRQNCSLEDYSAFKDLYDPMNALQIAFTHADENMVKLLIRAGIPIEEHQIRLNRLPDGVRQNEELVEWMYDYLYSPKPLSQLCSLQLRSLFGTELMSIVETLVTENCIPRRLADTILMKDLLQEKNNTYLSSFDDL